MLMAELNEVNIPLKKLEVLEIWNSADCFYAYFPGDGITASPKRALTSTYCSGLPFLFTREMEPVRNVYILLFS
jgi:hypothetical protein